MCVELAVQKIERCEKRLSLLRRRGQKLIEARQGLFLSGQAETQGPQGMGPSLRRFDWRDRRPDGRRVAAQHRNCRAGCREPCRRDESELPGEVVGVLNGGVAPRPVAGGSGAHIARNEQPSPSVARGNDVIDLPLADLLILMSTVGSPIAARTRGMTDSYESSVKSSPSRKKMVLLYVHGSTQVHTLSSPYCRGCARKTATGTVPRVTRQIGFDQR